MSAANVLKFIKEKDAEFVDLRFTDPRGKLQHLTMDVSVCIVSFNSINQLKNCLSSLNDGMYPLSFEVIIIDVG